jgi:hypothetical protein
MDPIDAVVAVADPLMAAKNADDTTVTNPNPPVKRSKTVLIQSHNFLDIPPLVIMVPAKI